MILRGSFWMGLTWLCLTFGPVAGLPSVKSLHPDCGDCEAPANDAWRQTAFQRLQALKTELKTARQDSERASERAFP